MPTKPFLRFYYSETLRKKTISLLSTLEQAPDATAHRDALADVVADRLLSRRALEIRFRKALGRSPHQEIQRVRLERARRLLRETDLAIPRVAEAAGYGDPAKAKQVLDWAPSPSSSACRGSSRSRRPRSPWSAATAPSFW